ncbi:GcrA family cell cycle regulator [Rhizobium mongolense]|uniref:GcrA family cell cycle regulator protein n=1 Tax=Rhizobium gallicum TaxID=56730 RepID=A0A1L5NEE8_9HYPH|nr:MULTISPECIES: GcrA family cell cycle regulator [Rhizobium]OWK26492.1 GcrA cell cycle regulator [Rhizobium yanglingense]APO66238.1 GcrA family cell cycle regulator protein [Rhizobium gallicum]QPB20100.1 GcrA family cell cycle regulator [Rhizobium sp. 007]ULJ71093.1 GcrA family cell cycle regulator [Rhizobium gallicum]WFU87671.1 GcrA family cell cycle regulator [Rhizobium sp. CC1099]
MNWTDERVEKLKKLWSEGLSASQIAAQLGGVSRNAVIGKVHRLSLPGRAKAGGATTTARAPKRNTSAVRAPNYASRMATRTVTRQQGATMLKEEVEIDLMEEMDYRPATNVVVPISRRLGLTELTERTCKWPVGDPLKDDFHFCGCDSPDSSPYCSYHQRLAYQPVNERRRTAARAS